MSLLRSIHNLTVPSGGMHVAKIGRLFRSSKPKKQSKMQSAAWRLGVRGVRIGEASNPGPLTIWSLNSRGTNGAYAALRLAETPDIWLFQETWFDDNAALAFTRTARKRGYIAYTQNNKHNKGGVAVLVKKAIPQRFASRFNLLESQGVFVWVQGLFLGSIYAPPHEHCSQGVASGLVEAMVASIRFMKVTGGFLVVILMKPPMIVWLLKLLRLLVDRCPILGPRLALMVIGKLTGSVPIVPTRSPLSL